MNTAFELSESLLRPKSRRLPLRYSLQKISRYEYWPVWLVFFPVLLNYVFQAIRYRSLTFFTAANPSIEAGGLFGESKLGILQQVPALYRPTTFMVMPSTPFREVREHMREQGLSFPVIAKPDKGERGWGVEKIDSEEALLAYYRKSTIPFLIQEFISYELELAVMYYRYPDGLRSGISSLASKEFLRVCGDGRSRIIDLMMLDARAAFQVQRFCHEKPALMQEIPAAGEKVLIEPIGNHCRGTRFVNACDKINPALVAVFDRITQAMPGFYFGRFDIRVRSWDDLYAGQQIRIMEVNGVSSEPAHIYGSDMNLLKAWKSVVQHSQRMGRITAANHEAGVAYESPAKVWQQVRAHRKYLKNSNAG